MPTRVLFTFPWGRYHATAWDRNANEGQPDWPPSPWRLLRAFYAAWQWHCSDVDEAVVNRIFTKLSSPPRYHVPPFRTAHTRHYYPGTDHLAGVTTDTVKTFDAFVVTARNAAIAVEWPEDLDDDEAHAFDRILEGVAYLGRADSLVEASRTLDPAEPGPGNWIQPVAESADIATQTLLAPSIPMDFDALTARAVHLRAGRLRRPPGSAWVRYPNPAPHQPAKPGGVRRSPKRIENVAVRFALTGQPIRIHDAVALNEALRGSCLNKFGGTHADVEPALAGKTADGSPMADRHVHAHFLAFAAHSSAKRIDTMAVWVPASLSERALNAVAQRHELRSAALDRPWRGKKENVDGTMLGVEATGHVTDVLPELCGPSRSWRTVTPFGLTRHARQIDETAIMANVAQELARRDLPTPTELRVLKGDWLSFRRSRPTRRNDPPRRAFGLEITFAEPVAGPIAIGYLSHFGLGLFAPISSPTPPSNSF